MTNLSASNFTLVDSSNGGPATAADIAQLNQALKHALSFVVPDTASQTWTLYKPDQVLDAQTMQSYSTNLRNDDSKRFSRIVILDAKTGSLARTIDKIHVDSPTVLAVSPEGRWFATAANSGQVGKSLHRTYHGVTELENRNPICV